ncbi:hypothetical protein AXG93_725s1070 [Marchantia polymorpha subsp. ruderalis]|uniref:Uncharacterized protein n=1 Tax=Marchantia polymorpha subsp. ruderalis TaxID=1480154 RepID=A0A176WDU6_MARPO|nr:hypothetical protein AXG93_725s1070 [Marchantia polymorpha subsp. ruderalis]
MHGFAYKHLLRPRKQFFKTIALLLRVHFGLGLVLLLFSLGKLCVDFGCGGESNLPPWDDIAEKRKKERREGDWRELDIPASWKSGRAGPGKPSPRSPMQQQKVHPQPQPQPQALLPSIEALPTSSHPQNSPVDDSMHKEERQRERKKERREREKERDKRWNGRGRGRRAGRGTYAQYWRWGLGAGAGAKAQLADRSQRGLRLGVAAAATGLPQS